MSKAGRFANLLIFYANCIIAGPHSAGGPCAYLRPERNTLQSIILTDFGFVRVFCWTLVCVSLHPGMLQCVFVPNLFIGQLML